MKLLLIQTKNCSKMKLNFFCCALFHTNTKVCLILLGKDCTLTTLLTKQNYRRCFPMISTKFYNCLKNTLELHLFFLFSITIIKDIDFILILAQGRMTFLFLDAKHQNRPSVSICYCYWHFQKQKLMIHVQSPYVKIFSNW